ncbi:putative membrane protein [Bradyrhizobium elkanii USDA 61]|uniref:Putative membrane protein n=1 Tax=Bradyrhizobium elkanii TaxID=29448 RepID=A0A8I2C5A3_BRAEL|nr:putative membrane protein [Bradyrhizobium elkanii]MCS4011079.1 putative membrane protein [Bradyrhizobium elkanii USDA 61]MCP1925454.1 putative membrane protein [Bradyrhizobium elkanii]MCP1966606.1 putative membrane protein [Bradyrhizobium elkanii]MCS3477052.1 putative membrane protein [Bradyrhizobium elkanii]
MPSTSRINDPLKIGVPTSKPNSVSFSPSSCLIRIPMIEKIVQTAKQIVKEIVESQSARLSRLVLEPAASMVPLGMAVAKHGSQNLN